MVKVVEGVVEVEVVEEVAVVEVVEVAVCGGGALEMGGDGVEAALLDEDGYRAGDDGEQAQLSDPHEKHRHRADVLSRCGARK